MWKVSVTTSLEAEDAVAELLASVFGLPAVRHTDFKTNRTTVAVYSEQSPSLFAAKRRALIAGLMQIRACGLKLGPGRIRQEKLRRENWAESWKRHFKPITIGNALLVKPTWIKHRAKPGQAVVVLDPGLSFGTGQHPTTSFCLREVVRNRKSGHKQAFLDLGTGSGILAIAAAKLGYAPVRAIDCDPEAVRVARANARANRQLARIHITRQDVTRIPLRPKQRYDVICANLISILLVAERQRIVARLKPGGVLVVAGILKREFATVARNYRTGGLRLIASQAENEWHSGSFSAAR